jgi:AcrR family transcriptional regulator
MAPSEGMFLKLRQAFLDFGYEVVTMGALAEACDLTRRGLYHHFSSKEDAFRFVIARGNELTLERSLKAAREALDAGKPAIDVLHVLMETRYGETRRGLAASPHAQEINDQAFRRCRAELNGAARVFQDEFALLLEDMATRGLLMPRAGVPFALLAQLLADGARGVNQARPPVPMDTLSERYRQMIAAILYGTVEPAAGDGGT